MPSTRADDLLCVHIMDHDAMKGKSPLMIVAQVASPDAHSAVLVLLATGSTKAEVNQRDHKGRTALMLAARCGSHLVVQLLIEAGADLEALCDGSETAWAKASHGGHRTSALLLEEAGARHGQSLGWTEEPPTAMPKFAMPRVSSCGAARFGTQFRNRMPVCMPGLVEGWPASRTWTQDRERLTTRLGGPSSRVPHLQASSGGGRMMGTEMHTPLEGATLSLASCLSWALDTTSMTTPMMSNLPLTAEMLRDLGSVPQSIFGSPSVAVLGETSLSVSSPGSITPLHFDHCHSVICQVVGRKRVTCFAPRDATMLYPFCLSDGNVRTSRVDLWTWRFGSREARSSARSSHPGVASAMPLETVLCPGDVVYIPPGWWHHVETLDSGSISVLMPFQQSSDEQHAMDHPWTLPGWGEEVHPPQEKIATPLLCPTCVDPMLLEGFPDRVGGTYDESLASRAMLEAEGAHDTFRHEPDWCDLACAQIQRHRFGVIRLPAYYAQIYQRLLQPSLYPPSITDQGLTGKVSIDEMPTTLAALIKTWGYVCESICRQVTRKLLALNGNRPAHSEPTSSEQRIVETVQGLLRVSYSASAHNHHGHYDGSYTTFLGPGNTGGCLQFAVGASRSDSETPFLPSEHFLQNTGPDALQDGGSFFIFTGVKHGGPLDRLKPLWHRVMPPHHLAERDDVRVGTGEEPVQAHPTQRINVIYFLNSYRRGPALELGEGACSSLTESDATLEINSFSQSSIVSHARFLCWPPSKCAHHAAAAAAADAEVPHGAISTWTAMEDSWNEEQAIDWSGDGL